MTIVVVSPSDMMSAAAPKQGAPRRINDKIFKTLLPAVPRRGPEAGIHHAYNNILSFGMNRMSVSLQSPAVSLMSP